ncbi:hypothetical protein Emag_000908 [Eimeria magna]
MPVSYDASYASASFSSESLKPLKRKRASARFLEKEPTEPQHLLFTCDIFPSTRARGPPPRGSQKEAPLRQQQQQRQQHQRPVATYSWRLPVSALREGSISKGLAAAAAAAAACRCTCGGPCSGSDPLEPIGGPPLDSQILQGAPIFDAVPQARVMAGGPPSVSGVPPARLGYSGLEGPPAISPYVLCPPPLFFPGAGGSSFAAAPSRLAASSSSKQQPLRASELPGPPPGLPLPCVVYSPLLRSIVVHFSLPPGGSPTSGCGMGPCAAASGGRGTGAPKGPPSQFIRSLKNRSYPVSGGTYCRLFSSKRYGRPLAETLALQFLARLQAELSGSGGFPEEGLQEADFADVLPTNEALDDPQGPLQQEALEALEEERLARAPFCLMAEGPSNTGHIAGAPRFSRDATTELRGPLQSSEHSPAGHEADVLQRAHHTSRADETAAAADELKGLAASCAAASVAAAERDGAAAAPQLRSRGRPRNSKAMAAFDIAAAAPPDAAAASAAAAAAVAATATQQQRQHVGVPPKHDADTEKQGQHRRWRKRYKSTLSSSSGSFCCGRQGRPNRQAQEAPLSSEPFSSKRHSSSGSSAAEDWLPPSSGSFSKRDATASSSSGGAPAAAASTEGGPRRPQRAAAAAASRVFQLEQQQQQADEQQLQQEEEQQLQQQEPEEQERRQDEDQHQQDEQQQQEEQQHRQQEGDSTLLHLKHHQKTKHTEQQQQHHQVHPHGKQLGHEKQQQQQQQRRKSRFAVKPKRRQAAKGSTKSKQHQHQLLLLLQE